MNATITAIRNVDKADAQMERELQMANAREVRKSSPIEQNKVFASQFSRGVADREEQIEKLQDHLVVTRANIDSKIGGLIDEESQRLTKLMEDVERSRSRLERLETERVIRVQKVEDEVATQIAAAERAIRAFRAASTELGEGQV